MSCSSFSRCGFLMRSFLPFGSLVVSRGLGSCGDEVIRPKPVLQIPEGLGKDVRISATAPRSPKTIIRYPDKKSGGCED